MGFYSSALGPQNSTVAAQEATSSASYTDLITPGPSVTVNTGTFALVFIDALIFNSVSLNDCKMSVAVSGASTIAAADSFSTNNSGTNGERIGTVHLFTNLTPGSNTFTAKYATSGGTGQFGNREIVVLPFLF